MLLFIFNLTLTAMTFTVFVWGLEALDLKKKERKSFKFTWWQFSTGQGKTH